MPLRLHRSKHIDLQYNALQDWIQAGRTRVMCANAMTKNLFSNLVQEHIFACGLVEVWASMSMWRKRHVDENNDQNSNLIKEDSLAKAKVIMDHAYGVGNPTLLAASGHNAQERFAADIRDGFNFFLDHGKEFLASGQLDNFVNSDSIALFNEMIDGWKAMALEQSSTEHTNSLPTAKVIHAFLKNADEISSFVNSKDFSSPEFCHELVQGGLDAMTKLRPMVVETISDPLKWREFVMTLVSNIVEEEESKQTMSLALSVHRVIMRMYARGWDNWKATLVEYLSLGADLEGQEYEQEFLFKLVHSVIPADLLQLIVKALSHTTVSASSSPNAPIEDIGEYFVARFNQMLDSDHSPAESARVMLIDQAIFIEENVIPLLLTAEAENEQIQEFEEIVVSFRDTIKDGNDFKIFLSQSFSVLADGMLQWITSVA